MESAIKTMVELELEQVSPNTWVPIMGILELDEAVHKQVIVAKLEATHKQVVVVEEEVAHTQAIEQAFQIVSLDMAAFLVDYFAINLLDFVSMGYIMEDNFIVHIGPFFKYKF